MFCLQQIGFCVTRRQDPVVYDQLLANKIKDLVVMLCYQQIGSTMYRRYVFGYQLIKVVMMQLRFCLFKATKDINKRQEKLSQLWYILSRREYCFLSIFQLTYAGPIIGITTKLMETNKERIEVLRSKLGAVQKGLHRMELNMADHNFTI